jgi:hypothetical protein
MTTADGGGTHGTNRSQWGRTNLCRLLHRGWRLEDASARSWWGGFIPSGDQLQARCPALRAYGYNSIAARRGEEPDNPGLAVNAWWNDADAPCDCRVGLTRQ